MEVSQIKVEDKSRDMYYNHNVGLLIKSSIQEKSDGKLRNLNPSTRKRKARDFEETPPFSIVDEHEDIITIKAADMKSEDEIAFMECISRREQEKSRKPSILRQTVDKQKLTCLKCQEVFYSKELYRTHTEMGLCIIFEHVLRCPMCSMTFSIQSDLAEHLNLHRRNQVFCNKNCGASFETLEKCQEHEIKEHNSQNFKCYICGRHFGNYNELLEHKELHQHWNISVCSLCRKLFNGKSKLEEHWLENENTCGLLMSRTGISSECGKTEDVLKNKVTARKRSRKQKHIERIIDDDDIMPIVGIDESCSNMIQIKSEPIEYTNSPDSSKLPHSITEPLVCIKTEPVDEEFDFNKIEIKSEPCWDNENVTTSLYTENNANIQKTTNLVQPNLLNMENCKVIKNVSKLEDITKSTTLSIAHGATDVINNGTRFMKLGPNMKIIRLKDKEDSSFVKLSSVTASQFVKNNKSFEIKPSSVPMVQIPKYEDKKKSLEIQTNDLEIKKEGNLITASAKSRNDMSESWIYLCKNNTINMEKLKELLTGAQQRSKDADGDADTDTYRKVRCIPRYVVEAVNSLPEKRDIINNMLQQIKNAMLEQGKQNDVPNDIENELSKILPMEILPDVANDNSQDSFGSALTSTLSEGSSDSNTLPLVSETSKKRGLDCPHCGRAFSSKKVLNGHIRSDCSRVRLYPCLQCNKKFFAASTLRVHLSIHTGELPFKCKYCDRSFRTRGQVNVHHRRHTGERPFQCQVCSQAFTHRETLISHLSRHIGIRRYRCYGCNSNFPSISGLQMHRESRPNSCGKVELNTRAVGPRIRVVRGNVFFEPQPKINPYLRTAEPPEVLTEIQNTNKNN